MKQFLWTTKQYFIERRGLAVNQKCADSLSMSCSQRPAPQSVIDLIEGACGHRLTQTEWHGIKTLAEAEGYDCSRRIADPDLADTALTELAYSLAGEWRLDSDDEDYQDVVTETTDRLLASQPRQSVVSVAHYLAENGLSATLQRIHPETIGCPPVRQFAEVTHIGTFETNDRKDWSLEGDGLSVSVNPEAWSQIALLGGNPQWTLTREDGKPLRFLEAHSLTEEQRVEIADWGKREGLVEETTVYLVTAYDDELEDEYTTVHTTREEALEEAYDPDEIEESTRLMFVSNSPRGAEAGNSEDILLTLWAERNGSYDGVWWQDQLNPSAFSAPRGVILPSRLPKMARVSK